MNSVQLISNYTFGEHSCSMTIFAEVHQSNSNYDVYACVRARGEGEGKLGGGGGGGGGEGGRRGGGIVAVL